MGSSPGAGLVFDFCTRLCIQSPMPTLLQSLILVTFVTASGWTFMPACPASRLQTAATPLACRGTVLQESDAPPAPMAEDLTAPAGAAADFTEDLLDALAADEVPLSHMDAEPVFVKSDNPDSVLEPRVAYTNEQSLEAMRNKYKLHESDTGSVQVQIAVLTARISYMTTHMQKNKKDYASLRGLTRMVVRRRRLLQYLLQEDLSEFKRLTSELNIRTNQLLKPKLQGARGRRV